MTGRKCGSCKHYEPAPIWRKGWCRNPLLYSPQQSHLVGVMGSDSHEEVVVRDLDMNMIRQVRNTWQVDRDRRPESYATITKP